MLTRIDFFYISLVAATKSTFRAQNIMTNAIRNFDGTKYLNGNFRNQGDRKRPIKMPQSIRIRFMDGRSFSGIGPAVSVTVCRV